MSWNSDTIRAEFPILAREVNNKPLAYLDNGASAQKPKAVLDAVHRAYGEEYANVHRGLHYLSNLATTNFESVRGKIQRFLGAEHEDEILFTSGTTEAMNLISHGWGLRNLTEGDEIILSIMEHHANIVPWHFLREALGVKLVWVDVDAQGDLPVERIESAIAPKTRAIALAHMSNVLGTKLDIASICRIAREKEIVTIIDGSQAAVHMPVDVSQLGCDFYAITGHKLYGPSGSGALYARRALMEKMDPYKGGGNMIKEVTRDQVTYHDPPHKFEAGTPAIVPMIGLGHAIDFIAEIGFDWITQHEDDLRDYAQEALSALDFLTLHGNSPDKGAIFSFSMQGLGHAHDISTVLDQKGIAVRAGHHCAQPLMNFLGVSATARASFAIYNTKSEVDRLSEALILCRDLFS